MKLPHYEQATVSEQKLTQYLLSLTHPIGSGKAHYFIGHGFSVASWRVFADALLRHAAENEVAAILQTQRGVSSTVEGLLTSLTGEELPVRVGWFQDHGGTDASPCHGISIEGSKTLINELSTVVLLVDIPEHGLRAGDVRTVVDVHTAGAPGTGYSVEFLPVGGDTIAVLELEAEQLRPTRSTDIMHVREAASA